VTNMMQPITMTGNGRGIAGQINALQTIYVRQLWFAVAIALAILAFARAAKALLTRYRVTHNPQSSARTGFPSKRVEIDTISSLEKQSYGVDYGDGPVQLGRPNWRRLPMAISAAWRIAMFRVQAHIPKVTTFRIKASEATAMMIYTGVILMFTFIDSAFLPSLPSADADALPQPSNWKSSSTATGLRTSPPRNSPLL
jgi:hypothetical protein